MKIMDCFYHQGSPAVGICKDCYKGLCKDCFADTGQGGACKGLCEEKVYALSNVIDFNMRRVELMKYDIQSIGKRKKGILLFGVLLFLLAVYQLFQRESISIVVFFFAGGFFVWSLKLHRAETRAKTFLLNETK
jgi:hypothetical protein